MWRFRLFGHPVRVEWTFWLVCVLLGAGYARIGGQEGIRLLVSWVVIVFASILWHELGHAFARRRFREPYSEIRLYSFGGLCSGPGRFTRFEAFWIAAAGPIASLLLGAAAWLLAQVPGVQHPWLPRTLGMILWVNVGWSVLNLLPVLPLDGGRMTEALLANRAPRLVPRIGLVVATLVAALAVLSGQLWIAILFGYLAYANYQRTKGLSAPMM